MEKKVIVYSTTTCGFCVAEKDWLEYNKIPFEAKNIDIDEEARKEFFEKIGGQENFRGVPMTEIDGEFILGFDRPKLTEKLGISRF